MVDEWVQRIREGSNLTVLAEDSGSIAGYAALAAEPLRWTRSVPEVRLNVAAEFRSRGLGSLLISELVALAPEAGARKVTAQMTVEQAEARRLFARLGFHEVATLDGWVVDRRGLPRDLVIVVKDVGRADDP